MKIKLTSKAIISILLSLMVVLLLWNFYLYYHPKITTVHQKCQDDYSTNITGTAEYNVDFDTWTNNFYDTYPSATLSDWSKARYQFWVDNNCLAAIERYNEVKDNHGDTAKMKALEIMVSEMVNNPQYISDLGFSFSYTKNMSVMADPDDPRLFITSDSWNTKENEKPIAVIISATLNDPPMTPLEWLKGPNSGADLSKGYKTLIIDSQEAISLENGTWIIVNTPDNKRQLSIATLPSMNPSWELIEEMKTIVDSLVFSK